MNNQKQHDYVMTQAEVAKEIGVTRSMVNHIEKQALAKIKKALEEQGIKAETLI